MYGLSLSDQEFTSKQKMCANKPQGIQWLRGKEQALKEMNQPVLQKVLTND